MEKGFINFDQESVENFITQKNNLFIRSDKKGKTLFQNLQKHYKFNFVWSSSKQNEFPDFLIKTSDKIFIIEHKHVRESGGGQDKQVD